MGKSFSTLTREIVVGRGGRASFTTNEEALSLVRYVYPVDTKRNIVSKGKKLIPEPITGNTLSDSSTPLYMYK